MPPKPGLTLFSGGGGTDTATIAARRELLRVWSRDRWAFLTGKDVDGTPMIYTKDETSDEAYRPFPEYPYLRALLEELYGPHQVTLLDKPRQMTCSTLCMCAIYHDMLFQSGRKFLLSKQTEELAEVLLEDKLRGIHRRTPEWFQQAMPLSMEPKNSARAARTGSEIFCVGQNAASRWFKGNSATITLIDEAAVQEFFEEMLEAAKPMSRRIWAITTAFHGNPGAAAFYRLKTEA